VNPKGKFRATLNFSETHIVRLKHFCRRKESNELVWIWLQSGRSQSYDFFDRLLKDFSVQKVATFIKFNRS